MTHRSASVADPARDDHLVALTDKFNKLGRESIGHVNEYRAKVSALNSNDHATREEFEMLISEQDSVRDVFLKKVLPSLKLENAQCDPSVF